MQAAQDPQDPPGNSASDCNNVDAFGFTLSLNPPSPCLRVRVSVCALAGFDRFSLRTPAFVVFQLEEVSPQGWAAFNKKGSYSFGEDSFATFDVGETLVDCSATCNGMEKCDGFTFKLLTDKQGECKLYELGGTQLGHLDENRVASYRKCNKPTTTEYVPDNFTVNIDGDDSPPSTTVAGAQESINELVAEAIGVEKLEDCARQDIAGYDTRKSY
eukprot:4734092-Amphidinium_carterae.1